MMKSLFKVCLLVLLASCDLAFSDIVAVTSDADMATLSTFGTPFNSDLIATVRQELNARVDSIWVNYPDATICGGCLIDHWHHNAGTSMGRSFPVSQLNSALAEMPPEVSDKVRTIVFGNKVVFEMFSHTVSAPTASAHYVQYVGIARRNGENVDLAVLKGEVVGRLVQKYNVIRHRKCKKILGKKICCCKEWDEHILRGYHPHEIQQIETGLRAETVRRLKDRAQDISF